MSNEIVKRQKKLFLDALPNTYDKSEGTVIVDFATANALANEMFFILLENIKTSLDYRVATGEDLTSLSVNFGIYRKLATYSKGYITFKGVSGTSIPLGFTVASDKEEYKTTNIGLIGATGTVDILVTCKHEGSIGNAPVNSIKNIPISLVGLDTVNNNTAFSDGANVESDIDLRERVDYSLRYPATSGNKNHYFLWTMEVAGVGGARIIVKPSGAGSMKVAIVDNQNGTAQQPLIDAVKENILNKRPSTSGTLEVVSATPKDINVSVTGVTIDSSAGRSEAEVLADIIKNVTDYINLFSLEATEVPYVGIVKEVILTSGVANYTGLTLNGANVSIPITGIEIPRAKTITATV